MEDVAISVRELKKYFPVPESKDHGILHQVRSLIGFGDYSVNKVINGISFEVKQGECFGIIGPNGTGKSTLMKLLAGVLFPDEGTIEVSGTVFPLLNLGVGFQNDLTAKDNVFQYGSLLGLSDAQLNKRYEDIFMYADLKGFENLQLKYFSSGMRVRLAFSIAMEVRPEILLLDEVLAVGDVAFKSKSNEKILEICNSGSTVVIVSHNTSTISDVCDRAMFLKDGTIRMIGETEDVIDAYLDAMAEFLGPDEMVPARKRREKMLKKERERNDVRLITDILNVTGLPKIVERTYGQRMNDYLDQYISLKNLTKNTYIEETLKNITNDEVGFGYRWATQVRELGDEMRSRAVARHLLDSVWDDGVLIFGREDFSEFFSENPENTDLFVPKNLSVAMVFEESRIIPVMFDSRERMMLDIRSVQKILNSSGCASHDNSLLAIPSELIHRAGIQSLIEDNEISFLFHVPAIEIEDNSSCIEFFNTITSPENVLLYEDTPLFTRKGVFNLYGPESEGFGYFSPALFSKDAKRFYSEIQTQIEAFTAYRRTTTLKPQAYIREMVKKNERYFSGVRCEGLIEVQPDTEAIEKRYGCLGTILLLTQGQHDPLVCYRYNDIRWITEQWFNHYCQIFSQPEPIPRGQALLKLIDLTIQICINREKLMTNPS